MSFRLLKFCTLISTCIFSLACTSASSSPKAIITPIEISEWETRLPAGQGTVKITFTLPQRAKAEFQLFDGKPRHINYAVTRVTLSDENCTSGHLVAVNYKKSSSDYHIKYFEKEAVWNETNILIMSWNTDDQIITTLNGEVINTDVYNRISTLKIVSRFSPIKIHTLEYLPL